jgi:hypothetical protein
MRADAGHVRKQIILPVSRIGDRRLRRLVIALSVPFVLLSVPAFVLYNVLVSVVFGAFLMVLLVVVTLQEALAELRNTWGMARRLLASAREQWHGR